jgi:hypothetical protein
LKDMLKIAFISGLTLLIIGVIIVIKAPATVSWEQKSRTLVNGETLTVSAKWKSNSWRLIEEVLRVETHLKYDERWAATPSFFGEEKDFVITGSAVEQSSPPRLFNIYVFDEANFDLWKAGLAYKAYYEDKEKTSVSFSFSIPLKEDLPSAFYFVVEEHSPGVEPTVLVDSTISWTEKSSKAGCSGYVASPPQVLIEQAKDFRLRGNATEGNGNRFNFYIMDYSSYWDWLADKNYTAIFELENVSSLSFDISLTEDQVGSAFSVCFVVENPLKDTDEEVSINAVLEWQEERTVSATPGRQVLGGIIACVGFTTMVITGIAFFKTRKGEAYGDAVKQSPSFSYSSKLEPSSRIVNTHVFPSLGDVQASQRSRGPRRGLRPRLGKGP